MGIPTANCYRWALGLGEEGIASNQTQMYGGQARGLMVG